MRAMMPHGNLLLVSAVIRGTLTEICMVFQTAHRTCMHMVHSIDIYMCCRVVCRLYVAVLCCLCVMSFCLLFVVACVRACECTWVRACP